MQAAATSSPRSYADLGFRIAVWIALAVTLGVFGWLIANVVARGGLALDWSFWVEPPTDAGRLGGIGPIVLGTAAILAVCLAAALPIAIGAAFFLVEYCPQRGLLGRLVGGSLDVLAAVPSVVFGLFGNALFVDVLGMGYSILAGGLTLACMILPLLVRTIEASLAQARDAHRLAAAALGIERSRVLFRVLLPLCWPGLLAGIILGVARALSETAALLFTSGTVDRMPGSIFDSIRTLSVHVYDLAMNVPGGEGPAYGTALVLILLLVVINTLAVTCAMRVAKRSPHS